MAAQREVQQMSLHPCSREQKLAQIARIRQHSATTKESANLERSKFFNAEDQNAYIMHKPHPSNIIKGYIMRDILNFLIKNNYIK
jgi:hypothetical protein